MTLVEEGGGNPSFPIDSFRTDSLNTDVSVMLAQAKLNAGRGLPWFKEEPAHDRAMILVAGGPSLEDELLSLRFMQGDVFALNGTHDYLIERGIVPDYMVLLDAREENAGFVEHPHPDVHYLIAAVCHPSVFDKLTGCKVTIWANDGEGMEEACPDVVRVGGGATVGMKALYLGYLWGYRELHLYGFDSCYRGERNHAYPQPLNDGEERINIELHGETFVCAPWMAKQATEFQGQARKLLQRGCSVSVHGAGLISAVLRHMARPFTQERAGTVLDATYDLARAPASFDFIQWLANVEMARKAWGCTGLRVHLKPGPNGGFRDDDLPGTADEKRRMVENVIRPAIRMFGAEECNGGEPVGIPYLARQMVAAHNAGLPIPHLKIDPDALEWAERYSGSVVITLREASYWLARNSDLTEWMSFAERIGKRVVFVRDTDKADVPLPGFETCPEASLDLHKRAALYSRASCVMGVASGPSILTYLADTPFAHFVWPLPGYHPWSEEGWLDLCGIEWGAQYPFTKPGQRIFYEHDRLPALLRAYETITKEST